MPSQLQRGTPHVDAAAGTRSGASIAVGPTCPAAVDDKAPPNQNKTQLKERKAILQAALSLQ